MGFWVWPSVALGVVTGADSVGYGVGVPVADSVGAPVGCAELPVAEPVPTGGSTMGTPAAEHWETTRLETAKQER